MVVGFVISVLLLVWCIAIVVICCFVDCHCYCIYCSDSFCIYCCWLNFCSFWLWFWIVFAICLFGLGKLKRTERPSTLLERELEEFWFVGGRFFWISCRIVCIKVPMMSSCEMDAVAISGCGAVAETIFTVASDPLPRLGSISMKACSSTARARAASGLAVLLFRSSHLRWASWRPSMKLVRTDCSSMKGCPLYTLLASVRTSQRNAAIVWFGCCRAAFSFGLRTSTFVVYVVRKAATNWSKFCCCATESVVWKCRAFPLSLNAK